MDIKKFDVSRLSGNKTFDPTLVGYEDSIDIIEEELKNARKSFVKIGWYLKHIDERTMYKKDGYADIYEFAYAKLKMSPETVNRFVNVCKAFSVNHDSPELDEQYSEFKVSQLFEMLPMKEEDRKEISSDMTVKQIREKKAEQKTKKEPSDQLIAAFCKTRVGDLNQFSSVSELKDYLMTRHGKSHSGGSNPNFKCTPRGISLNNCEEMTWLAFSKRAWELRAPLNSQKVIAEEAQNIKEAGHKERTVSSAAEEKVVSEKPIEEDASKEIGAVSQNTLEKNITEENVPESDSAPILEPETDNPQSERKAPDYKDYEKMDYDALLQEACRLSEDLYKGFKFAVQNNTLSEIERYQKWSLKLNTLTYYITEKLKVLLYS